MKIYLPLIALGIGILLVSLSFLWPRMTRKAVWSEEQAMERAQLGSELHALAHSRGHAQPQGNSHEEDHGHQHSAAEPAAGEFEAVKQRFEGSTAALEKARARMDWTARLLKWAGGICALLGAAGYFILVRSAN